MERLLFQKTIDLNHQLQELISLNVKDHLNYTISKEGKRAQGTLDIEGEYYYEKERKKFTDLIEIDLLAPFNRLDHNEEFCVMVEDYDYHIASGNVSLDIHVNAYGVLKKEDRHIYVDDDLDLYEEIKELTRKEELVEVIEAKLEEVKKENVLDSEGSIHDFKVMPKFEENEMLFNDIDYQTLPCYVAKVTDTYETIAALYDMNEERLKKLNQYKEIEENSIVFLEITSN